MNPDEIRQLYDQSYAASYEDKFLHATIAQVDRDFEEKLIGELLPSDGRWLDAACGTGYFLSRFPNATRAGLDLSPAMIEWARAANPSAELFEGDLREARPEWVDQWDLVTCMWYAYGLVDSLKQVLAVLENLAAWTSPNGTLMLPISDPRMIARANFPYQTTDTPWEGDVFVEAILWSYVDEEGQKCHAHQISPTPEFLVDALSRLFARVESVRYPPAMPGWEGVRTALVAKEKIENPEPPALRFVARGK